MDTLEVKALQVSQLLTQIAEAMHHRREMLGSDPESAALADEIMNWENQLRQLQCEILPERSIRLRALFEASHSIYDSLDWRNTLQAVMDAVIRITEAERGVLLVYDEDRVLQPEVLSDITREEFTQDDLKLSYSVVEQALLRRRPILTTNAQLDPRFRDSESVRAYGLRAILCAPLIARDEALGVIYLDNRARSSVFTADDLGILAAFARQASAAIANAREHRQTDQALAERVRQLTILQEMARDLNTSLKFDRVMERSVSWAVAAAGAEAGAIAILAEEGLRWTKTVGAIEPDTEMAARCLRRREPVSSTSALALPLVCDERPIGILLLSAPQHGIRAENLDFAARVADTAAIAVENARLYEALRQANQAKSEFVSTVSHELRTPMTSIRGYADMLAKGMVGTLNAQQQEFTEAIRRNTLRMQVLVSDLLDIARIEAGRLRLTPKPVNLRSVVLEALQPLEELRRDRQHTLTLDVPEDLPQVYADPNRLAQILINLFSNAIKYTPAERQQKKPQNTNG